MGLSGQENIMASLMCRSFGQIARRVALIPSARTCLEAPPIQPQKGKVVDKGASMPDQMGHTVGPERWELLSRTSKSNADPYEMNISEMRDSSITDPILIPSTEENRIIGCICEEDALAVNWMYLYKGETKRCECGHWFRIMPVESAKYAE